MEMITTGTFRLIPKSTNIIHTHEMAMSHTKTYVLYILTYKAKFNFDRQVLSTIGIFQGFLSNEIYIKSHHFLLKTLKLTVANKMNTEK